MNQGTFDRFAKGLALGSTRRNLLRGLGGIAGGGMAFAGIGGSQRAFARAYAKAQGDPQEQAVLLYEQLAALAEQHASNCTKLRDEMRAFEQQYGDDLRQMQADVQTWTFDQRMAHAQAYGDRMKDASVRIQAHVSWCQYEVVPEDASRLEGIGTPPAVGTPEATPVSRAALRHPQARLENTAAVQSPMAKAAGGTGGQTTPALDQAGNCGYSPWSYCTDGSWMSPSFQTSANCPNGFIDSSCTICPVPGEPDANANCMDNWPQNCRASDGSNRCRMHVHVPESTSCCESNCPISAADCALNVAGTFTGDYHCLGCMTAWCGSYDRCMGNCQMSDCCGTACSETDNPSDVPHGH